MPYRWAELEQNTFDLNYALSIFLNEQDYSQASALYINGGRSQIHHNTFKNVKGSYSDYLRENLPHMYHYMPSNYYEYA